MRATSVGLCSLRPSRKKTGLEASTGDGTGLVFATNGDDRFVAGSTTAAAMLPRLNRARGFKTASSALGRDG